MILDSDFPDTHAQQKSEKNMSPTPDSSNEAEKFLSPDQNGAKVVSSSNGAADDGKLEVGVEDGKGGKEDGEGKKCCTKKCCLVATGVVVG